MRPIDADALVKRAEKLENDPWNRKTAPSNWAQAYVMVQEEVENAPTIDAVPVIRCTKCKYYGFGDHAGFWRCENWGVDINRQASPPETFYCADAERKV